MEGERQKDRQAGKKKTKGATGLACRVCGVRCVAAHAAELQSCRVARHGGLLRHRAVKLGPQCWLLLLQVAVVV